MSSNTIRLTDALDAVPVVADPSKPRHQGRQRYGDMRIGQVYLVDKAEAERLIKHKGFSLANDPAASESDSPTCGKRVKGRAETATNASSKE